MFSSIHGQRTAHSFRFLGTLPLFIIMCACMALGNQAVAGPPIGINASFQNDWTGEVVFADAMKVSRQWSTTNLDSNGWPNADANIYVWAGTSANYDTSGTYALSFNGQATVTGATVSNQVYNSGTNTTTATIVNTNTDTMQLTFANTKKTSASGTNTGISNVKLMRPTSPGSGTSYSTATTFTTQSKALYSKFSTVRYMDFTNTNANPCVNWSDRTRPAWASQDHWNGPMFGTGYLPLGAAWEYAVQLSNESNTDMWINLPIGATDAYITNLANLIAFGSDGTNPYTSTQASPVYAPLNSGLHVYVEFANEVWNTGGPFTQSQTNHTAAINEVNAGGSPLNFDGDTGDWNWAARRTAKRTVEISNIFRTVFGSGAMMSRVRPVLESQQGYTSFWLFQQAHMLEDYYNNSHFVGTTHPPSYYIYGGAGSAYYNPNNSDTTLTLTSIWTSASFDVNTWTPTCKTESGYAVPLYGHRIAYEGGPSMDNCGCAADTIKQQAWSDARMTTIITGHQTTWNQNGGDLLVYYTAIGDTQWGFATSVFNLSTPKVTGINNIDAGGQATGTFGAAIPGTITASASQGPDFGPSPGSMNSLNGTVPTWLGYMVANSSAGTFNIALSAGSSGTTNQADIYADGAFVGTINIPNTGSNSTFSTTSTVTTAALAVGSHGIMVKAKTGSFGFGSVIVTAGTGGTVPPAPTGLTASAGNTQVILNWTAASGATTYNIYRGTASGGEGATAIATGISATTYTNTGLTNGTTYYYKVAGVNSFGTGAQSSEASATPVAAIGGLVKINAGGPAAAPFVADADFSGGLTATNWTGTIDTTAVTSPAPQAVYQSERYGASTYTIGGLTAGVNYQVRLHFCENYFTASAQRVFNVAINSTAVLTNYDIYAATGAIHKANIQQFNVAANASGQEVITLTTVTNNALINGIEINALVSPPSAPTGLTATAGNSQVALSWTAASYNVLRSTVNGSGYASVATGIAATTYTNTGLTNGTTYYFVVTATNAGGTSGNSNQASATPVAAIGGLVKINAAGPAAAPFVADADFSGGLTATNWTGAIDTTAVASPAPQAVYQSERYGAMSYTIGGLTAGTTYQVRLHFCENYFTATAQRVFNVAINSTAVLTNYDIFAASGAIHKANIQQFNIAANASGQEVITFTNVTNNALVNGIEINAVSGVLVSSVRFYPRVGWATRMTGGIFQGSTNNTTWTNLVTVSTQPTDSAWTTLTVSTGTHYRYLRYLSPNAGYGDVAEIEFYNGAAKLTGTGFGTAGSWNNSGTVFSNALDGNTTTYFDAPEPGNGDYVGIDLGS